VRIGLVCVLTCDNCSTRTFSCDAACWCFCSCSCSTCHGRAMSDQTCDIISSRFCSCSASSTMNCSSCASMQFPSCLTSCLTAAKIRAGVSLPPARTARIINSNCCLLCSSASSAWQSASCSSLSYLPQESCFSKPIAQLCNGL